MAGALSLGLLAACSNDDDPSDTPATARAASERRADANAPVTITVAGLLPTADDAAKQQLADRVTAFEAKYPNITVEAEDYEWKNSTFTTQLAGGTLPNVFEIPLTDGKTLIENGQLADIDQYVKALPYGSDFNPKLIANGQGADGKIYAVPAKSIYAVALHYNRNLFKQAGLDPDKPPTTWDEVRADAKQIHDKTGSRATRRWRWTRRAAGSSLPVPTRAAASSRRSTATASTPPRSTTRRSRRTSSGSRPCAGRTTRCSPAPTSAGVRSTPRSAVASSRCTRRAPTSTTRSSRATASPRTGATA